MTARSRISGFVSFSSAAAVVWSPLDRSSSPRVRPLLAPRQRRAHAMASPHHFTPALPQVLDASAWRRITAPGPILSSSPIRRSSLGPEPWTELTPPSLPWFSLPSSSLKDTRGSLSFLWTPYGFSPPLLSSIKEERELWFSTVEPPPCLHRNRGALSVSFASYRASRSLKGFP